MKLNFITGILAFSLLLVGCSDDSEKAEEVVGSHDIIVNDEEDNTNIDNIGEVDNSEVAVGDDVYGNDEWAVTSVYDKTTFVPKLNSMPPSIRSVLIYENDTSNAQVDNSFVYFESLVKVDDYYEFSFIYENGNPDDRTIFIDTLNVDGVDVDKSLVLNDNRNFVNGHDLYTITVKVDAKDLPENPKKVNVSIMLAVPAGNGYSESPTDLETILEGIHLELTRK